MCFSGSNRCLAAALVLAGAAMLGASAARADSCQELPDRPDCEVCVPDGLGSCCHAVAPCYCVYDQCLAAMRTPAGELGALAQAIFAQPPSVSPPPMATRAAIPESPAPPTGPVESALPKTEPRR
jgi:hypothetical protein